MTFWEIIAAGFIFAATSAATVIVYALARGRGTE